MRIAVDGRTIIRGKSGVGTYVERTIRALLEIDRENEYYLFLVEPLESLTAPNLTKVFIEGYQRAIKNRIWENVHFPKFAIENNIDLFFGAAYALPLLPRWRSFAKYFPLPASWKSAFNTEGRIKYVATILDVIGLIYPETFTPKMRMWQKIFVSNAARIADAIISISESTKRDLLRLYPIDETRVHVTPLSVDTSFRPEHKPQDLQRVRSRYSLPEKFILYVGTIEPRKNVAGIATAYSMLPADLQREYSLVIAGSRGWYADDIIRKIENLRLQDYIKLIGFVEDVDLPPLMSLASLFLFPSMYEGFGYPPLEAMASGVPVISSTTSSLPEVVGDAGILINPTDYQIMSSEILRVLRDDSLRSSMRKKGLERAKLFNWRSTALRTLEVFRSTQKQHSV